MEFEFDFNELDKAVDELADMLTVRWPKENKKFLRQEASKELKLAKVTAKSRLKTYRPVSDKKGYLGRLKRGKIFHEDGDMKDISIRVYSSAPHGHLIEHGHVMKTHDGGTPKHGEKFVKGYHILEDTHRKFDAQFQEDINNHIDDMIAEGRW